MCRVTRPAQPVFAKYDVRADRLRTDLAARGTTLVNLFSGPRSGSSALLEALLARARERALPVAAFAAATQLEDAPAAAAAAAEGGATAAAVTAELPVKRLLTGGLCHLEPAMVDAHLRDWPPYPTRLLFVENVGEPSCPAPYELGESLRVALTSVTEGEQRPLRSPLGFGLAHAVVVTRYDLAEAVDFDPTAFRAAVHRVNPGVPVVFTSARSGQGIDCLLDLTLAVADGTPPHRPALATPGARVSYLYAVDDDGHAYAEDVEPAGAHAHGHVH
ncbi:hydrogenase nickel incorporation protein HypB [Streptacidiphilus fuscans]|uniref:hydrogenase nickel incorporation protein HypB n=1 Tax=Streptacidiphilus fuscans TaxID=2789292 RepID=UPI002E2913CE|nr:hydrogenase nickel incorporation protein HypB [Streptacidiphilus fuscans]